MNTTEAKVVLEAALLTAAEPLGMPALRRLFDDAFDADTIRVLLGELGDDWAERGLALTAIASGWRFQTRPTMRNYLGASQSGAPATLFTGGDGDAGDHRLPAARHAR